MKKLLILTGVVLLLVSCSVNKYKVTGCFPDQGFDGETVYLSSYDDKEVVFDSTSVEKGCFTFEGKIDEPAFAQIVVKDKRRGYLILENGEINMDMESRVGRGTELNDKFYSIYTGADSIGNILDAVDKEHNAGTISDSAYVVKNKELVATMAKIFENGYHENENNPLGYYCFLQYTYDFTPAQFDSIAGTLPDKLKETKRVRTWMEGAKKKEKTSEGKKFTDFTIVSEDGQKSKLSDFVGKGEYVLVDFWASWCGPCIRETKVIKDIYNEYNGKGLSILGVAVWDKPSDTNDAIKKYELPWRQIINAQTMPTDIYGINGIPHIIIFGPDGTILSRGLQGAELKAKVKSIMDSAKK